MRVIITPACGSCFKSQIQFAFFLCFREHLRHPTVFLCDPTSTSADKCVFVSLGMMYVQPNDNENRRVNLPTLFFTLNRLYFLLENILYLNYYQLKIIQVIENCIPTLDKDSMTTLAPRRIPCYFCTHSIGYRKEITLHW